MSSSWSEYHLIAGWIINMSILSLYLLVSCFSSSNFFLPLSAVSVMEVECVREGCQSETLRQMVGSVPEGRCLTVVFKGPRKSLDLLCQSQEEAQQWARGIRRLQERVKNMTQKEKLDQYPFLVHSELWNCLYRVRGDNSAKDKSKRNCHIYLEYF